jgi:hypothetical protein
MLTLVSTECSVQMRCGVGETGAVQRSGGPVAFTVLHVEGFKQRAADEGVEIVPVGERSRVMLRRPPDEVESAVVEFACPTCGRAVSARVRSRAGRSRMRRGRLARALVALLVGVLILWVYIGALIAQAGAPAAPEPTMFSIVCGMVVMLGSGWAVLYGLLGTALALWGKGIAIEGEADPPRMAGALGPEDQFHVDGARFMKHDV